MTAGFEIRVERQSIGGSSSAGFNRRFDSITDSPAVVVDGLPRPRHVDPDVLVFKVTGGAASRAMSILERLDERGGVLPGPGSTGRPVGLGSLPFGVYAQDGARVRLRAGARGGVVCRKVSDKVSDTRRRGAAERATTA